MVSNPAQKQDTNFTARKEGDGEEAAKQAPSVTRRL